jgi:hypothetical protein
LEYVKIGKSQQCLAASPVLVVRGNPDVIGRNRHLMGQEKIENKANVNLGKIDVSSLLTS